MAFKTQTAVALADGDRQPGTIVAPAAAFVGNDVVDLANARGREPLERAWMERHLTPRERESLGVPSPVAFWSIFSAKEAGYKAFAQAGMATPKRAFAMIEADLANSRVRHAETGATAELLHLTVTADCVHTVALYSPAGDETAAETVLTGIAWVPESTTASDYARERLLTSIGATLPGGESADIEIATLGGIPRIRRSGRWEEWSISLSHSGRLAAWAWVGPGAGSRENLDELLED
jgi:phosphopantetheinyl transferase (holo-ACP synthase)